MEDKRAHERLDSLEILMVNHIKEHIELNTSLKVISENTAELVALVKGVKGFRSFVLWVAPFVAALFALWAWAKGPP